MKSWQTTIAGIIAVLCGAVLIGIKFNRGETLTEIEWATVGGLLAVGYGLFRARDNHKTSEQVKAGRPRTDFIRPKLIVLCALSMLLIGCGSPASTLEILPDGTTKAKGNPTSEVRLPVGDGDLVQGTFTGASPTGALIDSEGIHMLGGGPNGLMAFNPKSGMFFLASPRDVTMRDVKFTPQPNQGEPSFEASEITANASPVIQALNEQYASAMEAMQGMTQEEAKVYIQRAVTAGEMLPVVADMLLKSFVPTLPTAP